jgi:hypothetical protein
LRTGVFLSQDPVYPELIGAQPYTYVHANPSTLIDPTGLQGKPAPRIKPFTFGDLRYCLSTLRKIALTQYIGNAGPFPCASKLLFQFLYTGKGANPDPCPDVCSKAIKDHFGKQSFLDEAERKKIRGVARCNVTTALSDSVKRPYEFKSGDLFYAFHLVTLSIDYACKVSCSDYLPYTNICCCLARCGYTSKLTDRYDFCDSLPKNEPRRSLAWCGCLLEQEGYGRTYPLSCPLADLIARFAFLHQI